jgi:tetratricopeptide (TPR) repeat protein
MEKSRHGNAVTSSENGNLDSEELSSPVEPSQLTGTDRKSRIWLFGLALLAFAVRAPGIMAGFVFDDVVGIEHRTASDSRTILGFFTTNQSTFFGSNLYRPVLNVWYEVSFRLFGIHAMAWHLSSIVVHVICTLLVFRLALVLVENVSVAWAAAALYAVHPAHVEAISWASAMGDPLFTMLMLLSVLAFLRWMEQGKWAWWAASFASGTACIFTKETAVVLPVVLLATVFALRSRAKPGLPVLAATVPFFASAIVFLGLRQSVLQVFSHNHNPATTAGMIFTWPSALLFYLRHMFWPSVVVPFYPLYIVSNWKSQEFFGSLIGLIAVSGVLGYLLWRSAGWRNSFICLTWILVPLAPALYLKALAPLELVHDRFLYAPLVGFCIAAALVLRWATAHIEARVHWHVFLMVAVALITLLSIETMSQMVWWRNNKTLFTRALTVTPDSTKALVCLAAAYMGEGRIAESVPLLRRALDIDPQDSIALFYMARIEWLHGDDAAAEKSLVKAIRIHPTYDMWVHLSSVELHLNHVDVAEAAARQAVVMNPRGPGAHASLGTVLLAKGERVASANEFREELRNFPESEGALAGLALSTDNQPR